MINLLSYVGMDLHSEVRLWTLLGLLRSIFDATLFKVNANLKLVWSMSMPPELTTSLQRALRTLISGVMLVQCFTVYVYIAAYIVLLYPVFLEEKPNLVLPWLLLAAVRNLLCELTSLTMGLGACGVLGPARPPCVKFLVNKLLTITPSFYAWLLVLSYYNVQKMSAYFPAAEDDDDPDYGLELAVRRRRTKSLFDETLLRKRLVDNLYKDRTSIEQSSHFNRNHLSQDSSENDDGTAADEATSLHSPVSQILNSNITLDMSTTDSNEVELPRDADRILEQFVIMLLKIAIYLKQIRGEDGNKSGQDTSPGADRHKSADFDMVDKFVPNLWEISKYKKKLSVDSITSAQTDTNSQVSRGTEATQTSPVPSRVSSSISKKT